MSRYFSKGLTAEKYNEIRRKVYLDGDIVAQYWLGLIDEYERRAGMADKSR